MVQCRLRRAVYGHVGVVVDAAHRGDVYNASIARFLHVWSGKLAKLPRREDIYSVDAFNVGAVDFKGILASTAAETGIVYKDIYRAVCL